MVDYKKIADGDPTGPLEAAFNTMAAETVATTPEKLMTYRTIASEVSFAASVELETGITTAGMPKWLDADLQTRGIDVNSPDVAALIGSIVSAPTATAILAAGVVSAPVYPGLALGHLQNARQQRAAGEV
jgi:hypothetical protein